MSRLTCSRSPRWCRASQSLPSFPPSLLPWANLFRAELGLPRSSPSHLLVPFRCREEATVLRPQRLEIFDCRLSMPEGHEDKAGDRFGSAGAPSSSISLVRPQSPEEPPSSSTSVSSLASSTIRFFTVFRKSLPRTVSTPELPVASTRTYSAHFVSTLRRNPASGARRQPDSPRAHRYIAHLLPSVSHRPP